MVDSKCFWRKRKTQVQSQDKKIEEKANNTRNCYQIKENDKEDFEKDARMNSENTVK